MEVDTCHAAFEFLLIKPCTRRPWPARTWFLKIDPIRIVGMRVCVCVCVCAPEAINN